MFASSLTCTGLTTLNGVADIDRVTLSEELVIQNQLVISGEDSHGFDASHGTLGWVTVSQGLDRCNNEQFTVLAPSISRETLRKLKRCRRS